MYHIVPKLPALNSLREHLKICSISHNSHLLRFFHFNSTHYSPHCHWINRNCFHQPPCFKFLAATPLFRVFPLLLMASTSTSDFFTFVLWNLILLHFVYIFFKVFFHLSNFPLPHLTTFALPIVFEKPGDNFVSSCMVYLRHAEDFNEAHFQHKIKSSDLDLQHGIIERGTRPKIIHFHNLK